jgi:hypothetical protein
VVAVGAMIATGTKSLENGAIGESARGAGGPARARTRLARPRSQAF